MTTTDGTDSRDVSLLALEAFEAVIARELTQDASVEVRTLLGTAFAAAFEAIEAASGTVEVDEAWRLPGSLDRLRHLDAAELTDPHWHADVQFDDREELIDLLSEAVDEIEWLASTDDSNYAGFTSSGGADFYAVHHRGSVFWFQTNMDYGDPYVLEYGHAEGDEDGRRRMLGQLIDDYLIAGSIDVHLSDAFDDELRRHARLVAEANFGAPWDTGILDKVLDACDDEDLARHAVELAEALAVDEDEILASLRRLRDDRIGTPATELDRIIAWNVSWPDLRFRS
ncbi:MAG: hypothetical protein ACLGI8_05885 [Acidimicrobiia bacterium]